MSTIDLERMIVRQTYFIPVKASQLRAAVRKELEAHDPSIYEIRAWYLEEEHENSFCYECSMRYHFVYEQVIGMKEGTREYKRLVKEKSAEYKKMLPKIYHKKLKTRLSNLPMSLYVFVTNTEENGCSCDIQCFPTLYQKLNMKVVKEASEFEIQDAYLTCRRFLKSIFESGLSATFVTEKIRKVSKPAIDFLINDISNRQLAEKVETMLSETTGEILIIGWVGTILLKKLKELKEKGVEVKVITGSVKSIRQDPMRKEKERAMKKLINIIGKENISIKPEFHGRAIVVDNKALVGSMDLDSYSLTGVRTEFATYTEDPEIVRTLRKYFKGIFSPLKKTE